MGEENAIPPRETKRAMRGSPALLLPLMLLDVSGCVLFGPTPQRMECRRNMDCAGAVVRRAEEGPARADGPRDAAPLGQKSHPPLWRLRRTARNHGSQGRSLSPRCLQLQGCWLRRPGFETLEHASRSRGSWRGRLAKPSPSRLDFGGGPNEIHSAAASRSTQNEAPNRLRTVVLIAPT